MGAPLAAVFAASGVSVIGYDCDRAKWTAVNDHIAPVDEPGLEALMRRENLPLSVAWSVRELVEATEACIFVTPTPSNPDGSFDHRLLRMALSEVIQQVAIHGKHRYALIVASTVMPGFMQREALPMVREILHLNPMLAYKPEFIALGNVIQNLRSPDVTIIGADDPDSAVYTQELYREIVDGFYQVQHLSLIEAELAKISVNCAVTMKISFANQVGMLAEKLGARPENVLRAIGSDRRVGRAALRYGLPFGGPCFPRDSAMFRYVAELSHVDAPLARATDRINRLMSDHVVMTVTPGDSVGILGLAYKVGTAITEESPGLRWKNVLEELGHDVKAHDPKARPSDTLAEVLACETIILACDWPEYRGLRFGPEKNVIDPFGIAREPRPKPAQEPKLGALDAGAVYR